LLNIVVSSENISESIKIKTENGFHLKRNVCKFHRNKSRPGKGTNYKHRFNYFNKKSAGAISEIF
jgi:hypothetical protein